ncbi:MAG: M48 family metallopeptidase [Nitrococcus sp.]|nr:M48 family metallopeptidase [Nitrococcus sp.]
MKPQVLLLLILPALVGCDQTPTGRHQLTLVPDYIMTDIGRQTFAQMRQSQRVVTEPAINERVRCVAREIIKAAARLYPEAKMPKTWDVAVFQNPTPNAFALPGGHIGVHTGMLRLADNPAQLAAVIGHEVGHLLANHGNERLTQQLGIKAVLLLVGLLGDIDNQQILQAIGVGARLGITLPFSRAHEEEADLMGLQMMAAAGFPPSQSVALWRNMARSGGAQPLEFLSTHPAHDTRIQNLQSHMAPALDRFQHAQPPACPP